MTHDVLKSECGGYVAERVPGETTQYRLFTSDRQEIGLTTFWSNHYTDVRIRFEVGCNGHKAIFSHPRFPKDYCRRWVECWYIELMELAKLIDSCGGSTLVAYKPDINCWHHVGFMGTPKILKSVDAELRRRKIGFLTRKRTGTWEIDFPFRDPTPILERIRQAKSRAIPTDGGFEFRLQHGFGAVTAPRGYRQLRKSELPKIGDIAWSRSASVWEPVELNGHDPKFIKDHSYGILRPSGRAVQKAKR